MTAADISSKARVLGSTSGGSGSAETTATPAIVPRHLRKVYGGTVAVDDASLRVAHAETSGVSGPNGSGTTTTVEMLTGLRRRDQAQWTS